MSKEDLPDCPPEFECSITYLRMGDPVIAADGFSYERVAIEKWFTNHATSPKTAEQLTTTAVTPNLTLLTLIKEWEEDQLKGRADQQNLNALKGNLFSVSTSKEAQVVVQQMIQLVTSSNFCLLSPDGVKHLTKALGGLELINPELTRLLDLLASQCQSEINTKQEMHRELNKKCAELESAKTNVINQEDDFKNTIVQTKERVKAAKNQVIATEKTLEELQKKLITDKKAVKVTRRANTKAEENLVKYKKRVIDLRKLCSEHSNERDNIERQLESVDAMEEVDSDSSSSSSSSPPLLPAGSKRGRSSSASSSSSTTRGSKRSKKEKDGVMEMHPGQWLYEEGLTCMWGMDFKNIDIVRGVLMTEASASLGFPMAVAECHFQGWNGFEDDEKKAFDMFVKIEKETNGHHWAQFSLGQCYHYGYGVDKDVLKGVEYYSLSAEQGNSMAMVSLGICYSAGKGTDVNKTKAFELYEKSANLGCSNAMLHIGNCYESGWDEVTKDLNKAREWYTKAAAQGDPDAQTALDELNAQ